MESVDEYPRKKRRPSIIFFFQGTNIRENTRNTGRVSPIVGRVPRRRKGIRDVEWPMEKEEERKREKKAGTTKIIVLADRTRRIPCTMECNSVITR